MAVHEPVLAEESVRTSSLKLAAWIRLNGQEVRDRRLLANGRIEYTFDRTPEIDDLIGFWNQRFEAVVMMARFANLVSYEVRKAVSMRRKSGIFSTPLFQLFGTMKLTQKPENPFASKTAFWSYAAQQYNVETATGF